MWETRDIEKFLTDHIGQEYNKGCYKLGWRFLAGPKKNLSGSGVAFIGLNPGGSCEDSHHGVFSCENGSAYECEEWGYSAGNSPLQQQVRALFSLLNVDANDVLAGNLIPFRSPNFDSLPNKKDALIFGMNMWKDVLSVASPSLIITMSGLVTDKVAKMLDAQLVEQVPLNWGKIKGRRYVFKGGTLIGLPHLSRFKIFNRVKSQEGLATLFEEFSLGRV